MRLAPMLFLLCTAAQAAPDLTPQFTPRADGGEEFFELALPAQPDGPCVTVGRWSGASVLVSRALLEELAAGKVDVPAQGEDAQRAEAARVLLRSVRPAPDDAACQATARSEESGGLIAALMDAGLVSVHADGMAVTRIGVRYRAGSGVGSAAYRLPDGRELFTQVWIRADGGSRAALPAGGDELF